MAESEPPSKRQRVSLVTLADKVLASFCDVTILSQPSDAEVRRIGTHNGTFHCDEALACAMLVCLWGKVEVVRTRDAAILAKCDVVVDVGGVYEPENNRFDHHQRDFTDTMKELEAEIKLSSAGLVYRHFGREMLRVLRTAVAATAGAGFREIPDALLETLYKKVYASFIEHIDGLDNGVNAFDGKMNYRVTTSLSSRVGQLNPRWNEDYSQHEGGEHGFRNRRFMEAMCLAMRELCNTFEELALSWWPARAVVEKAMTEKARLAVHPSGKVAELPSFVPWQSHLSDLEAEGFEGLKVGELLYVLYPDSNKGFRIQAVPKVGGGFQNRKSLPEPWQGARDEKCAEVTGVPGCIFVHANGFIGGNLTLEGARAMAAKAIEW